MNPQMLFDLNRIINIDIDLSSLILPISRAEIDKVIKLIPNDEAPGPYGFNGLFLKKCWPIIKESFYTLCDDFFAGNLDLESINNSFITLVPKVNNPEIVNDFRPISLLNTSIKLLTKILAERLQAIILQIIHANQYGFIKSRTIQDCLAWSFEYIHQCHQTKKEIIIFKLDFAKAFDTVEHEAIILMMQHLGFPDLWKQWIMLILCSGSSSIILNGVPGRQFKCKHGVRQGDPLSPLLFVLAVELLQYVINDSFHQGLLSLLIRQPNNDFPIIQYADDTILVMEVDVNHLIHLKEILQKFALSTGLVVNCNKSSMIPINVHPERLAVLASAFGCAIGSMPFTYLGLPMGTTKPKVEDLTHL